MGLLDDAIREHLDLKRQRGADPGEVERLEREALGPVRREPTGRSLGSVPSLDVYGDPEPDFEAATELHQLAAPVQERKRGFLRRHRPGSPPPPEPADFADGLPGERGHGRDDPFDEPDPFGQDAFDHDDPFPTDESLEHSSPAADQFAEPAATAEPPSAAEPAAEGRPPHLNLDSGPPPRPSFTAAPPGVPTPERAAADASEAEPVIEQPPALAGDPTAPSEPAPAEPAQDQPARADAAGETREWSVEEAFAEQDSGPEGPAAEPAEEDVLEETPEFLQDTPDHDRLWFEQRPPRDFDFDS